MSQPQTFEQALDSVLADMRAVMIERQKKYGPDNIRRLGIRGVMDRATNDKGGRLLRYYERQELREACLVAGMPTDVVDTYLPELSGDFPDDSVEDAHIDQANYAGPIALMLRRGIWGLPLADASTSANVTTTP